MKKRVAVLRGDGIGKEVTDAATAVLDSIGRRFHHEFEWVNGLLGGEAVDKAGQPLPEETIKICEESDAILLGAVGGPAWDNHPSHLRPERGLLQIRKHFELSVNLRPVQAFKSLLAVSPLKEEVAEGVDMMIVRELTGGLYFGEPSFHDNEKAVDTLVYAREEIERVVIHAFELAKQRRNKVTSVDKANVLESSKLWRKIVEEVAENYPEVEYEHMLVDAAAMKLITYPAAFDVVVTENMFGDILSDEASVITGSLGMLPSASLRADGFGMYEPIHGSAPDIAGQNIANPIGAILSAAMMLRSSFGMEQEASAVEKAVKSVLEDGYCTNEFKNIGRKVLSTREMTEKIINEIECELIADNILSAYV
ncbi:3-isopropylmalate dehydrogenase [Lederbergia citrea]|uniref:3-isopropylmalate dehydrogenase n=1 Tax=Lederbergia citrea TaxID=2833581 RepID=A0A942UNS3_9BACI|nr:3-isopropylmalate dehydrogenase [Lederbergia citrea]MBS4178895.1 3-isopropylmalate dehydrogenase [Lederbergia citrea]MBS4205576.1 3-isopropylmalate dehydrogenase [Lederbergia citrea]MBS4224090.1 3-isopropylmalate dehydrogenase [Lederbergia citrea]